ncbi:MAG: amino acid adenylation domain-containing protein [Stigonema ocellatum SAG 48.90 = DSM 106950]|nr:amino acid adenylation domain-containing protein [Stigonema ocellatum SAG 48.90 = DSM 106950]
MTIKNHTIYLQPNTQVDYPQDACIHQLFEAQVNRTPDAVAVVFEDQLLTYRELNCRANQLAHHLQVLGVKPDVLVAICVDRSLEMVVGVLGILKAGGAYVPLDPAYPSERLALILDDTQTSVMLTQEKFVQNLPIHGAKVICLDSDWEAIAQNSPDNPVSEVTADNLMYVIYTSGSTGKPKGVMIPHRGICNMLNWRQTTFGITQRDKVLQTISLSFDPSVWQIFWPLLFGAQLILARPGGHQDTAYLVKIISSAQITVITLVPSLLRVLLEEKGFENCQSLRHVTCGGEALPIALIERFHAILNKENVLHNCYGPTEASIDATFWTCQCGTANKIAPIGRPIANVQIYILNENLQQVPVGESGELHIGGAGLARGYLNRPELSAEKFICNPLRESEELGVRSEEFKENASIQNSKFNTQNYCSGRLYKTGDLGRYLPDGNIEFLGRIDNLVKIRGFRVELEEIEAILSQHSSVQETVVIIREDVPGDKRLVAYVVANREQVPSPSELQHFLKEHLPEYMVPAAFVFLSALPFNPNGKVDRRALPVPDASSFSLSTDFVAPRDELELKMTQIWEQVLNIQPIGVRENFFDIGGNSLLAVHLFAQIEQKLGRKFPLGTLLQAPTIEKLTSIFRSSGWSAAWSSLVPVQPSGSKRPFFCVAPSGGTALVFADLMRYMSPEQPFYALQQPGLEGKSLPFTSIEEIATHYIQEIRTLQPEGPYLIGGACFGSIVALEIAQQLYRQGQEVQLLAFIDAFWPENVRERPKSILMYLAQFVTYHITVLSLLTRDQKWSHIQRLIQRIIRKIFYKLYRGSLHSMPVTFRASYFQDLNRQFRINYVSQVYPGRLSLILPSTKTHWFTSDSDHEDLLSAWNRFSTGGVDIHKFSGHHELMFREPYVQSLAEKLQACLDEVQVDALSGALR